MGGFSVKGVLLAGAVILTAAAVFVAVFWWRGGTDGHVAAIGRAQTQEHETRKEEQEEEQGQAEEPAGYKPELSQARWDQVATEGEEGALVEVKYDRERGWEFEGWRVKGISLYGAPPFAVPARKWDDVPKFPCADCHKKRDVDPRPRPMKEDHKDLVVQHANDRIWCTDCHGGANLDYLVSRRGKPIDIDLGYLHCGECHFGQLKDWEFGVHGRRIGLFAGERVLRTCTECHNAHRPQILPDKPNPPPQVRANLSAFTARPEAHPPVWKRFSRGESP